MKKLGFLMLTVALTLCSLAQEPRLASAATCPTTRCATLFDDCDQLCGGVQSFRPVGTCTDGSGTTQTLFLFRCPCVNGECIE
jgi:hypothetical protein